MKCYRGRNKSQPDQSKGMHKIVYESSGTTHLERDG